MDDEDNTDYSNESSADSVDAADTDTSTEETADTDETEKKTSDAPEGSAENPTHADNSTEESAETTAQSQSSGNNEADKASTDGEDVDTDESSESTDEDSETAERTPRQKLRDQITKRRVAGGVALFIVFLSLLVVLLVPASLLSLVYSSSAEFVAQPVTVDQGTIDEYGYEEVTSESFEVTEQVRPLGQDKSIITMNHRKNYQRTVTVQNERFDSAIFTTVSTPEIKVAGSPRNPLAGMSHRQILSEFSSDLEGGYQGLSNFTKVTEREGVLLSEQTSVSQFKTTVNVNNKTVDVFLYVGTIRSGDDVVVAVGGHPAPFAQERLSILELMASVEHPAN